MDIRTFGQTQRTLRSDNSRLSAEVERLTHDLADVQTVANLQRDLHAAELATANDNAAELGKALDMCIAERDGAFADADLARAELGTLREMLRDTMRELAALRDERPRLLAANVRPFHDNEKLRTELDAERNAHNATAAQLYAKLDAQAKRHADVIERWKVEENTWHEFDKNQVAQINALRAELDAMRQAHSVVAARMEAMGC